MEASAVKVKVLDATPGWVKVKLPFLGVPVTMNREFFEQRLNAGYFQS